MKIKPVTEYDNNMKNKNDVTKTKILQEKQMEIVSYRIKETATG